MKAKLHLLQASLALGLFHSAWVQPVITAQPQNQSAVARTTVTLDLPGPDAGIDSKDKGARTKRFIRQFPDNS